MKSKEILRDRIPQADQYMHFERPRKRREEKAESLFEKIVAKSSKIWEGSGHPDLRSQTYPN